jgi:hypothetical protein
MSGLWTNDKPNVGLYRRFEDAIGQANFYAAITRIRYRVRYDQANKWWHVTATIEALRQP